MAGTATKNVRLRHFFQAASEGGGEKDAILGSVSRVEMRVLTLVHGPGTLPEGGGGGEAPGGQLGQGPGQRHHEGQLRGRASGVIFGQLTLKAEILGWMNRVFLYTTNKMVQPYKAFNTRVKVYYISENALYVTLQGFLRDILD